MPDKILTGPIIGEVGRGLQNCDKLVIRKTHGALLRKDTEEAPRGSSGRKREAKPAPVRVAFREERVVAY